MTIFGSIVILFILIVNNLVDNEATQNQSENNETFVCNISTGDILNANQLMRNNTLLRTWNDGLTILESAREMFYGCNSLTTFHGGNLSSLTDGSWMFYQCGHLSDVGDFDFSSLEDGEGMFC